MEKRIALLLLLSLPASAEITITKPNMVLVDENGNPIPNVTASTSIEKAMEKASRLPDGTYYLRRPDVKIVVNQRVEAASNQALVSWKAPTQNTDNTALTDLSGFNIYHGLSSDNLVMIERIDNPESSTFLVSNLEKGVNYFAITAVNENGIESEFSEIVSKNIR